VEQRGRDLGNVPDTQATRAVKRKVRGCLAIQVGIGLDDRALACVQEEKGDDQGMSDFIYQYVQ